MSATAIFAVIAIVLLLAFLGYLLIKDVRVAVDEPDSYEEDVDEPVTTESKEYAYNATNKTTQPIVSPNTQMILGLLDNTKFVRAKDIGLTKDQVNDLVAAGLLEKSRNGMIRKL